MVNGSVFLLEEITDRKIASYQRVKGEELSGLQLQHFGFVLVDQISGDSIFPFAFLTYILKLRAETALKLQLYKIQ